MTMDAGGDGTFQGRNAIIFGGGRNIGRAIALEFARRGAAVAVTDIDAQGARQTAQAIVDRGGRAVGLHADVTDADSMADAAARAEAALGGMEIVMNNAGLLHNGNPEDFPLAEWQRMFDCNLFGMVRSLRLFVPKLLALGRGHFVSTASFAGLYPYAANRVPYAASKAAILNLSENLALYLEPKGIRVSCLVPGPVMTSSLHGMKSFSGEMPMRGPGRHLWLKSQEEAALALADGMAAGRILIPTHEEGLETIRDRAADPDAFLRGLMTSFAQGDEGRPQVDKARFGLAQDGSPFQNPE
ncbi:MAG: SDR family oxidoreductase [Sphingobium sp.]